MVQYNQRCSVCRKNMVLMKFRRQRPVCTACEEREYKHVITDPKFKDLFAIDHELYKKHAFLRSIKGYFLKFETLTDKQIAAFKTYVSKIHEKSESKSENNP